MNDIKRIVDVLLKKNEIFNLSISKELTKKNEKTFRFQSNQFDETKLENFISKGEFVTIIQKLETSENNQINYKKIEKRIMELRELNYSKNDIVKILVRNESIKKNLAYELVIKYWG
jgi:16S rRNA C1402 (ribose-2'-O) methylase RsmI